MSTNDVRITSLRWVRCQTLYSTLIMVVIIHRVQKENGPKRFLEYLLHNLGCTNESWYTIS